MSDLFSAYAQQTIAPRAKPATVSTRAPSALEKRMQEKQRLSRHYRTWKRAQTKAILSSEPRLTGFLRFLRKVDHTNGGELIDALATCDWLRTAPIDTRLFALRMVSVRCDKINQRLGNEPLDDPLPPETSIYFEARALLHPGGRQ